MVEVTVAGRFLGSEWFCDLSVILKLSLMEGRVALFRLNCAVPGISLACWGMCHLAGGCAVGGDWKLWV